MRTRHKSEVSKKRAIWVRHSSYIRLDVKVGIGDGLIIINGVVFALPRLVLVETVALHEMVS